MTYGDFSVYLRRLNIVKTLQIYRLLSVYQIKTPIIFDKMKAIDRFYYYLTEKSLKPTAVEKEIGLSNGYLSAQKKRYADMGEGMMLKIIDYFRDINPLWLLTGEGSMLRSDDSPITSLQEMPGETAAYYKMYKEERVKVEVQAEEIGRLKQELESLKIEMSDKKITEKPTSASATPTSRSSRSGNYPAGSANVPLGTK